MPNSRSSGPAGMWENRIGRFYMQVPASLGGPLNLQTQEMNANI